MAAEPVSPWPPDRADPDIDDGTEQRMGRSLRWSLMLVIVMAFGRRAVDVVWVVAPADTRVAALVVVWIVALWMVCGAVGRLAARWLRWVFGPLPDDLPGHPKEPRAGLEDPPGGTCRQAPPR